MISYLRYTTHPFQKGYLIEQGVRCGKKNCRCYTEGKKHTAFYLCWREFDADGKLVQKKKYIRRNRVAEVQKQLASFKGLRLADCYYASNRSYERLVEVTDLMGNRAGLERFYKNKSTCKKAGYFLSVR